MSCAYEGLSPTIPYKMKLLKSLFSLWGFGCRYGLSKLISKIESTAILSKQPEYRDCQRCGQQFLVDYNQLPNPVATPSHYCQGWRSGGFHEYDQPMATVEQPSCPFGPEDLLLQLPVAGLQNAAISLLKLVNKSFQGQLDLTPLTEP